jgi:hypothetical protein
MKTKIALLVTILAASLFGGGCSSTQKIGDSWVGHETAENIKYGFKFDRITGDQFRGSWTIPNDSSYQNSQIFTLISIQEFKNSKTRIVTFQRGAGHVYRGKLTEDGTSIIEGTRGDVLGNTVESPKFSQTKWELHLEKPKAK